MGVVTYDLVDDVETTFGLLLTANSIWKISQHMSDVKLLDQCKGGTS